MVTNAASFGRSGVHDYILIRASAVVLACYAIFLLVFVVATKELDYQIWQSLFAAVPMKVFTIVSLIALLIHAWIGVWQVLTDYVKAHVLRGVLQFVFVVAAFSYLVAGIVIVWGV
ncbi:succinate dehydrogenase, hydrophobic membrane anchor protein [Paraferrimonas haliotis]|uniref:Succinate dehydrogenase hydrophobic membrane anchor subunit n=1 Tax=Paraferrimonas haliotis TaxID=2013866 RepID=A0AA37TP43_9GAMM|nr:succinate dehydrogenase, hydrophobic membrane anchor protein [Paraferrimonas haliotis]GLS84178.1 succinate dehydrogenase hydrophobic membrane anchor subunit [Paraferrimonas haliotis]